MGGHPRLRGVPLRRVAPEERQPPGRNRLRRGDGDVAEGVGCVTEPCPELRARWRCFPSGPLLGDPSGSVVWGSAGPCGLSRRWDHSRGSPWVCPGLLASVGSPACGGLQVSSPPPLGWVSLWPREGGWQGVRGWQRGWVSRNLLFPLPVAMVCVGAVLQNWICASVYLACLSWA